MNAEDLGRIYDHYEIPDGLTQAAFYKPILPAIPQGLSAPVWHETGMHVEAAGRRGFVWDLNDILRETIKKRLP